MQSLSPKIKDAARLQMQQKLAGMILHSMAEVAVDFATLDKVTGQTPGFTRRFVTRLMDGKVRDLHCVSDLALALHKEALFGFIPVTSR